MAKIEILMLAVSRMLGFRPGPAELRAARAELDNVPPEAVEDLSASVRGVVWFLPDREIRWISGHLYLLMLSAINYRVKMPVEQKRRNHVCCPRCFSLLEREYQMYCDRCGQHLDWGSAS